MNINSNNWFTLLLITNKIVSTLTKNFNLNLISQQIIDNYNPYMIIDFISKNDSNRGLQDFNVEKKTPKCAFEINFQREKNISCPTVLSMLNNSLHLSLIQFFPKNFIDVKSLIDTVTQCIPLFTRPKFLVVLFEQNLNSKRKYKNVLDYAWMHKFLDFTILTITVNNSLSVYYYNPFMALIKEEKYIENIEIFPDKLKNINKYPIKIAEGLQSLSKTPNWLKKGPRGLANRRNQYMINFIFKAAGFNMEYVKFPDEKNSSIEYHYIGAYEKELWFKKTSANVLGFSLPVMVAAEQNCQAVVAYVPIIYEPAISVTSKILLYTVIIPTCIFILILAQRFLKISQDLRTYSIIRLLFGQSISRAPLKSAGKIVFMMIVILFVLFTQGFYSDMIEINFGSEEVEFNSLEDLVKSSLNFYTRMNLSFIYFETNNPSLLKLEKKTTFETDLEIKFSCAKELKKSRNRGCIDWELNVQSYMEICRVLEGPVIVKVAKPSIFCDDLFFRFEPASPYVKKISNINRWIVESDIMRMEYFYNNIFEPKKNLKAMNSHEDEKKNEVFLLLLILIGGWIISFMAFITEIFMVHYNIS